mmetsp:Transcript_14174/g.43439  ORF Transcript_14174/g.43439 Transcript_14174/m.43439 type:complete len:91 (+) Transcript_14174:86-358(+)
MNQAERVLEQPPATTASHPLLPRHNLAVCQCIYLFIVRAVVLVAPSNWLKAVYRSQNKPEAGTLCSSLGKAPRLKPKGPSFLQISDAHRT